MEIVPPLCAVDSPDGCIRSIARGLSKTQLGVCCDHYQKSTSYSYYLELTMFSWINVSLERHGESVQFCWSGMLTPVTLIVLLYTAQPSEEAYAQSPRRDMWF